MKRTPILTLVFSIFLVLGTVGCQTGNAYQKSESANTGIEEESAVPEVPPVESVESNEDIDLNGSWSVTGWNPGVLDDDEPDREAKGSYAGSVKIIELDNEDGKVTCLLTWSIGRQTYTAQGIFDKKSQTLEGDLEMPNGMTGKISYKLEAGQLFGYWVVIKPDGTSTPKGYELFSR